MSFSEFDSYHETIIGLVRAVSNKLDKLKTEKGKVKSMVSVKELVGKGQLCFRS